ncbi:hypothetical protein HYW20_00465 [Candidatus Woesearchaeota archaeon]|nr:hypothetical protein [Candidatus Woesearchaeota archaeon]
MAFQIFTPKNKYYVTGAGLTTEELRESSLNDFRLGSITSVLAEFKSPAGITYYADHTRVIPSGLGRFFYGLPASFYIELSCKKEESDEVDFAYVESTLESIAKQKLEGVHLGSRFESFKEGRDYGPLRFIDVERSFLTNHRIAELINDYGQNFDNVGIPRAFFQNVRVSDLKHLDLPSEKVSIRGTRHLHPDDWKNPLL